MLIQTKNSLIDFGNIATLNAKTPNSLEIISVEGSEIIKFASETKRDAAKQTIQSAMQVNKNLLNISEFQ